MSLWVGLPGFVAVVGLASERSKDTNYKYERRLQEAAGAIEEV